jgi:hypothetical protein
MRTGEESFSKEDRLKLDYCCEISVAIVEGKPDEAKELLKTLEAFITGNITYEEANY